jgi:Bacterial membrane protein YfhO
MSATSASRRDHVGFQALVAVSVIAAVGDLLSADRIPAYRDLLVFVVPFKHFLATHLHRFEPPLWNPWLNMGTPFLASLHSAVFYPLSVSLFLPFPLGFNVFLVAHFVVAAAGLWLLSRERGLSPASCAVGALVFALGGCLVSLVNLTSLLQAVVWMPWVLLLWTRLLRAPGYGNFALTTIVLAILVLGGAPEIVLMVLTVLAAWTVFASPASAARRLRHLAMLTAVVVATLGLVAFQLLPTAEYVRQSDRNGPLPFTEVATWSMQPISLVQLLLPHVAPAGASIEAGRRMLETAEPLIHSIYLGLIPLCLAVATVGPGEARFWRIVAIVGLVLALGSATPVLRALYEALPLLVGRFRYPEKFYCVVHFVAAILAAEGAERCVAGDRRVEAVSKTTAIALLVVASGVVALRWSSPAAYLQVVAAMTGSFAPMTRYVPLAEDLAARATVAVVLLGSFWGILALRRYGTISRVTLGWAIAAFVAVDLVTVAHGMNPTVAWSDLYGRRPIFDVDQLRSRRERVFLYQTVSAPYPGQTPRPIPGLEHQLQFPQSAKTVDEAAANLWQAMFSNVPIVAGVGTLSGDDDGITRRSDIELREALSDVSQDAAVKLLRTFGVAGLAGTTPLTASSVELERRERDPMLFVYRVRDPVPAAYLASRLVTASREREALNRIIGADFTPGADVVVEELPASVGATAGGEGGAVRVETWSDRRIVLEATARRPSLLVVNDAYFDGWRARVDDREAPVVRANFLARGIAVDSGTHRVELRYRPASLRVGTAISLLTAFALATAATASAMRPPAAAQPWRMSSRRKA